MTFTTIYTSKLNRMMSITMITHAHHLFTMEIWVTIAIFVKPCHEVVTSFLKVIIYITNMTCYTERRFDWIKRTIQFVNYCIFNYDNFNTGKQTTVLFKTLFDNKSIHDLHSIRSFIKLFLNERKLPQQ